MTRAPLTALTALAVAVASCSGADPATDAGPQDSGPRIYTPFAPPAAVMRRLTQAQYRNTVADILGDDVLLSRTLEPDTAVEGLFSVGASETTISRRGVEQFEGTAFDVAQQSLRDPARRARFVSCTPSATTDDACARQTLSALGRKLWRRPLTDDELTPLVALSADAARTLNDFHQGLEFGLAALLQSPSFLFRVELGEPDPERPGERRYTAWETASRMAYLLWNGPPDEALLAAAEDGSLNSEAGRRAQADRMLADPRARRGLRAFVYEWLQLQRLDDVSKDTALPENAAFSTDMLAAGREEVLRVAERIAFDPDGDFRDLVTTRDTFVDRDLAALYNVRGPTEANQWVPVTLPDASGRRGLLGMFAFLAERAHPTSTSPTLRGRFIRETLLCNEIPNPPVNVNTALPEPRPDLATMRLRLNVHLTDPSCASCHRIMDPLGLGLENFDTIGRWRRRERGVVIDPSGSIDGRAYTDAAGLAQAVHDNPSLPRCVATRMYRFAYGRREQPGEQGEVNRLVDTFAASGYRMTELLRAVVSNPAFGRTGGEE